MDPFNFDKQFGPNYSRYPGDPYGLNSKYVQHYWNNHIRLRAKITSNVRYYYPYNFPHSNDPMARHDTLALGTNIVPRKWELAAVAPDLFDVTYFTILPYYSYTHFPKVQNLLNNAYYIRGDLGMYKVGTGQFQGKSILHQVGFDSSSGRNVWADLRSIPPPPRIPFFYKVNQKD